MSSLSARDFLLQRDRRDEWLPRLGLDPWFTACSDLDSTAENGGIYCGLVPDTLVEDTLSKASWDLSKGDGLPGHVVRFEQSREIASYHRFGDDDGIEPLVFLRTFHGARDSVLELSEEFRHFHKLYFDGLKFLKLMDGGTEEVVGRLGDARVELRLREVRQFIAIKKMHLAMFFDFVRYSEIDPAEIGPEGNSLEIRGELIRYSFHASPCDFSSRPEQRSFSRLLGKKLIPSLPLDQSGVWPYQKTERKFEDFIIGVDELGAPKYYTCDPGRLANYFGANAGAPHFLTPVYFRREVLAKYYANPGRFSVEDGYLRCAGLWGRRMDNNHPEFVVVFLGDLGHDLYHSEQLYWKSFNVVPEGGVSAVNFKRSFLGEFANPERPDLRFKYLFEGFTSRYRQAKGWDLFRPLASGDEHFYISLRIPLTNDQAEFDSQVLALAKVLVDSLNEPRLVAEAGAGTADEKGISKFARYLDQLGIDRREECVGFLRDLQEIRSSGVAHRKGNKYERVARRFGIGDRELIKVFEQVLDQASAMILVMMPLLAPGE